MNYGALYLARAQELLRTLEEEEAAAVQTAARMMTHSIRNGGIPHLFGSGHSRIPAKEVFVRAGTLSCLRAMEVNADWDAYERVEGLAAAILKRYALQPADMLFVISNSGINPLPIEMALAAREQEIPVVAVTSLAHSRQVSSRHSSGAKLYQVADHVIDTHVPAGDASIEMESMPGRIGPLSTLAGVVLLDWVVVETVALLEAAGVTPPVRISRNLPEGDAHNRRFIDRYGDRIPELRY